MKFHVVDKQTGERADYYNLVTNEEWAKHLLSYDVSGFALDEDGFLLLLDDSNNIAVCPHGRFKIIWEEMRDDV